jgi:cytochrome c oxidase assembly protein subunit 15
MSSTGYVRLAVITTVLALFVVVLGAYVRLTDAGLGCPDWPGCYGTLSVPRGDAAIGAANDAFPERPVSAGKAWREMAHRYAAGFLGLAVFALAWFAWMRRTQPSVGLTLPITLSVLIIGQAALGMWTVTMLLKPAIVTAHLMGGMTTLGMLWWLSLRSASVSSPRRDPHAWHRFAMVGVAILAMQIALGGWTSTNYAALACADFPTCHGQWLPWMDADSAFKVWHGLGTDYEGGILSNEARITIQAVHRLGALITFLYIGLLAIALLAWGRTAQVRIAASVVVVALLTQVAIGIGNIYLALPLPLAVAHNAGAAVLLLSVLSLVHALGERGKAVPI